MIARYTWRKLSPKGNIPTHRYGHTCTAIGKQLLIFGGRNKVFVLADMHIYNTGNVKIFLFFCFPKNLACF